MSTTERIPDDESDKFVMPRAVIRRAKAETRQGTVIMVSPYAMIAAMECADQALNGDSNDAEHDALCEIRERLSDWFEDPRARRKAGAR